MEIEKLRMYVFTFSPDSYIFLLLAGIITVKEAPTVAHIFPPPVVSQAEPW